MTQRSLKNQHRMLEVLLERFDAVDVTGLSAWERARAVHGRTAAGLAEGDDSKERAPSEIKRASGANSSPASPSAKSVAIPLFPEEEAT